MMDDMMDNRETPASVGERRVSNEESSREYGVVQYLSGTQLITVRAASQSASSVLVLEMPVSGIGQQVDHCFNNPPSRTPLPIPTTTSNIGPITAQDSDKGAAVVEHNLSTRRQTRTSAQLARNVAAATTTSQTNEGGSSTQKKEELKQIQPLQAHTTKTGVELIQEEGKVTRNATMSSTAATGASKRNLDASDLDSEDGHSLGPAQKTTEAPMGKRVLIQSTIQVKKPENEGRQEKKRRSQLQMLQAATAAIANPKIVSVRKTWISMQAAAYANASQNNEDGSSTQKKEEFKHVQPSQTHTTKTGGEPIQEEGEATGKAALSSTAATGASKRKLDASGLDSDDGSPPLAQGPKCKTQLETVKATSNCTQTESTNEQKSTVRNENIATVEEAQKMTEAPVKKRVKTQSTLQDKKPVNEVPPIKKRRSQLEMLQAANAAIAYPKIVSGRKTWNSMSSAADTADDNANSKGK